MIEHGDDAKSSLRMSLPQVEEQLAMLRNQLEETKAAITELEERRAVLMGGKAS